MFKKRKITAHTQRPTKLTEKKNELDAETEKEHASGIAQTSVVKKAPVTKLDSKLPQPSESSVSENPTTPVLKRRSSDSNDEKPKDIEQKSSLGVFNGKLNVANFIGMPQDRTSTNKFGPPKAASAHIRSTTMTDYAPDVCKDYKLTGFCGYGDSCKFLHIREDYAAGWKIDKEWEIKNSGNATTEKEQVEEAKIKEKEAEKIPTECPICNKPYKSPVVTSCNHFFCESCFLHEFRTTGSCFVCQTKTSGTVKPAGKLLREKLKAQNS